jgi:hypothetical protein
LLEFLVGRRDVADLVSPLLYASATSEAAIKVLEAQRVRTDLALHSWSRGSSPSSSCSRSQIPLLLCGDDVDVQAAMVGFDPREVTRILAELDATERWTDLPIRCDERVLAATAGPVFELIPEWPVDAVVAGGAVLHAAENLGTSQSSDLDVFVGSQESAENMAQLLQRCGYTLAGEREDKCECFAADFGSARVQVIVHPKASVPSALVRSFDLFASEAYWLPRERQGFATASAVFDWRTRTLHGGRNDVRSSRLNKYVAKGFQPGHTKSFAEEPSKWTSACQVLDLEDYSVFVRSAQRIQPWEPSSLLLRGLEQMQLQTPWVYCMGFESARELYLHADCPSHRALLGHVDELRGRVGVTPGNPIVRVWGGRDGVGTVKIGRFRGCLVLIPGTQKFRRIEVHGSTAAVSLPYNEVEDIVFQLDGGHEVCWDAPLFAHIGHPIHTLQHVEYREK